MIPPRASDATLTARQATLASHPLASADAGLRSRLRAEAEVAPRALRQRPHVDLIDGLLHARLACAVGLHAVGGCTDALNQAASVWREWTARHLPTSPASQLVALHVTGMLTACRRTAEAARIIVEADLALSDSDQLRDVYLAHLTVGAAERVLHRQLCTRTINARTNTVPEPR